MGSSKARAKRYVIDDESSDIAPIERDRALLSAKPWPQGAARALNRQLPQAGWQTRRQHLFRRVLVRDEGENAKEHPLWEALLRFPNASLYATHNAPAKRFEIDPWPNWHTMRVLGHDDPEKPVQPGKRQIEHVYLLHNGLNETDDILFHYRLAAWILAERPTAVCILRPLPGHLTRYPFTGPYAAKPLDDYLHDPADLFRQFLRHMLETQWLLSALVPRSRYQIAAGTMLLADAEPDAGDPPAATGRADSSQLALAMEQAWKAAFDNSEEAKDSPHSRELVDFDTIKEAIVELRDLLGWNPTLGVAGPLTVDENTGKAAQPEPPCVHVVGYSMGGFVAQAAFFTWPFAVSSCTNMFAGGALRDLEPTAFAHREEWQAVLHAMRYELDRSFRSKYLQPTAAGLVAGIDEGLFGYFTRIFYEVFLQYYRGGYKSRVAEFSRRLLFVMGGDDPIVRTRNVLDAGPAQGVTLLQIADVSHFPSRPAGGAGKRSVEVEQRIHWLPEVGRVIANFSTWTEGLLNRTLAESWGLYRSRKAVEQKWLSAGAPPKRSREEDPDRLDNAAFAAELNGLVRLVTPQTKESDATGWLLIARNEVPPAFLDQKAFLIYAQAVHHSEEEITRYMSVLRARAQELLARRERITLLVAKDSVKWFLNREERERFLSKSETASAARIPDATTTRLLWQKFAKEWLERGAAGIFEPKEYDPDELEQIGPVDAGRLELDKLVLDFLPDVWIAFSDAVIKGFSGTSEDRRTNEVELLKWIVNLCSGWDQEEKSKKAVTHATQGRARKGKGKSSEHKNYKQELEKWLESGDIRAIQVSGAELNSRYRGRRLRRVKDVRQALIHWALARAASSLNAPPGGQGPPSDQAGGGASARST